MQEITIEDLLALIVQGEGEKIEFKARSINVPKLYVPWLMPVDAIKGIFRKVKFMKNK